MKQSNNRKYHSNKPRYIILDGLRGIASIIVLIYHLCESYYGTKFFHGYLSVDFFFLLSGFVISYSYDDRWEKMTYINFLKRRLIRLHPMLIFGTIFGFLTFFFQECKTFPLVQNTEYYNILICLFWGFTIIPIIKKFDIRGWEETNPLNGVVWTLQYEYLANFLYAIFIRKISNIILFILLIIFAGFTFILCLNYDIFNILKEREIFSYTLIGGWSLSLCQLQIGFTRLLYPFFCGLFISRNNLLIKLKYGYIICYLIICVCLFMPFIEDENIKFINGIYEFYCIIFVFPLIVSIGAGSEIKNKIIEKINNFIGEISYPLYITHYPLIYMQQAYSDNHSHEKISPHLFVSISTFILSFFIAYSSFNLFDQPIRKWLMNKLFDMNIKVNIIEKEIKKENENENVKLIKD